jgi:uncharacterized protein (TIGR02246 family)
MRRRLSDLNWPTGVAVATLILIAVTGSAQDREGERKQTRSAKAQDVERVVQEQVEAYNKRDLDAFLATYSPDIKLHQFPDKLTSSGLEEMRKQYGALFEGTPGLKAEITKRIVQGDYVIDHEKVTFGGRESTAAAIYQVRGGKIVNVWFIQ